MDYFIYIVLAFAGFTSVFLLGWQFGLWMQSLDDRKIVRDLYTKDNEDFHNVYYTDNKCRYTSSCCKPKAKAKKNSKKK